MPRLMLLPTAAPNVPAKRILRGRTKPIGVPPGSVICWLPKSRRFTEIPNAPTCFTGARSVTTSPRAAIVSEWCTAISRFAIRATPEGFDQIASLPSLSATAACAIPTVCAPTGSRRNSAPSELDWAARLGALTTLPALTSAAMTQGRRTLERRRLIDQHDRDVIAYRIPEGARVTNETRFSFTIFEIALAPGANEDLEKLCVNAHLRSSFAWEYPNRSSADVLFRQFGSTLIHKSRYTLSPTNASIFFRDACPTSRMRAPLAPMM